MIDGIIKYNFAYNPSSPLKEALWYEIEKVRESLFALGLIGEKEGIGYGNISQKIDEKRFVITGTQTGYLPSLEAGHYAMIEAYDDAEFYLKSSGAIKPSSEALTHGTIYNLSPQIGAVIHIHSRKMWDFMLRDDYLRTDDVLYGSKEMIAEVKRIYQKDDPLKTPLFVMKGHEEGIISFGQNLQEAKLALYGVIAKMLS